MKHNRKKFNGKRFFKSRMEKLSKCFQVCSMKFLRRPDSFSVLFTNSFSTLFQLFKAFDTFFKLAINVAEMLKVILHEIDTIDNTWYLCVPFTIYHLPIPESLSLRCCARFITLLERKIEIALTDFREDFWENCNIRKFLMLLQCSQKFNCFDRIT